MNINGLVFEDGGCWLADIPALDMMVQGESFEGAFAEIQEVFKEELPRVDASFSWINQGAGVFSVRLIKPGQVFHEIIKRHRLATELPVSSIVKRTKRIDAKLWSEMESGAVQMTTAQFFTMLDALDLDVYLSVRKRADEPTNMKSITPT